MSRTEANQTGALAKSQDFPIVHQQQTQRFEMVLEGSVAYLSYVHGAKGEVIIDHTIVPPQFRGRGIAASLVTAALAEARKQDWKIVPACSYVATYIRRHPEYADLVE